MREFMLLMKGDDPDPVSPAQMQARMQDYRVWMTEMMAQDRLVSGKPLEPTGVWLTGRDTVITDGPFLEPREIIGGFVILRAADLAEATRLAQACPLLEHCEIYVRPVLDVG